MVNKTDFSKKDPTLEDFLKVVNDYEALRGLFGDLLAEVQRTREYGDLSENAEYKEAKREKNKKNGGLKTWQRC